MTMTEREKHGRLPVPADKWVRAMLEDALEQALAALSAAEEKETKANAAATEAIAMMVLWRGRVEHLKAALEAAPAAEPPPAPVPVPPYCVGCGKSHWMNEVCSSPGGPVSWPLHDEGGGQ